MAALIFKRLAGNPMLLCSMTNRPLSLSIATSPTRPLSTDTAPDRIPIWSDHGDPNTRTMSSLLGMAKPREGWQFKETSEAMHIKVKLGAGLNKDDVQVVIDPDNEQDTLQIRPNGEDMRSVALNASVFKMDERVTADMGNDGYLNLTVPKISNKKLNEFIEIQVE